MSIPDEKLKKILVHIPKKPGVYLMHDSIGKIIYVGKSRSLKNRVRSYFSGRNRDSKTTALVSGVADIRFIVTENEIEALVLENNLIKRHKPKFNVMLKDSKTHPYLKVTLEEEFPRLLKVRKVKFDDGNKYFGPFPDEKGLKFLMELLSRTFRLSICKGPILPGRRRPCLRSHLKLCEGPCMGKISREEYRNNVQSALDFLTGTGEQNLAILREKMDLLSAEFRFEEAAELRDTIAALENFSARQNVELMTPIDRDFWGIAESRDIAVFSIFFVRAGKLLGNRTIELETEPGIQIEESLGHVIMQFYESNLIPDRILCSIKPKPHAAIREFLSKLSRKKIRICSPGKPELKHLLKMADENAREILKNLKSMSEERVADSVIDLEKRLSLPRLPHRIECIDIAHVQGIDPVASLVVAVNGEVKKSGYRKFHVKTVEKADDPASIAEVTRRRFARLKSENSPLPDLFIVDGGIAQVNAAKKEISSLEIDVPVWGLAKREEILVSPEGKLVKLPFSSSGMRLLIKLRNEAHRFANLFHRRTHSKKVMRSALLNIPGVGLRAIQKILAAFGSIEKAAAASTQEIARLASIPQKTADLIHTSIQELRKENIKSEILRSAQ